MSIQVTVFSYVFTWHALSDACPKCQSLNGREYRDQDIFQSRLWDVYWGDIWDLDADHTLAHPNCRCQLEVRVNYDIKLDVENFAEFKEALAKSGFT